MGGRPISPTQSTFIGLSIQLSAATGLRPAATTALVDRLVRKGFVRRVASAEDRRQVLVEMTDEGMARTWECYGPMVEEGQRVEQVAVPQRPARGGSRIQRVVRAVNSAASRCDGLPRTSCPLRVDLRPRPHGSE